MTGFDTAEFAARTERAQALMGDAGIGAMLLTTEPDVRYFTGFLTRFWESPTRPWFVIVPATGKPVAVIPGIGADLMGQTWVDDIRTWSAPDLSDDGISLLCDTLRDVAGQNPVAVPDGHETHVRMPLADLARLQQSINIASDNGIMRQLRMIKSPAEIAKVKRACQIAGKAFARVPEIAREGVPLDDVFRAFQMLCLEEGADWVPYLAGAAAQGGYSDVISPAHGKPLQAGDVLMLDTGLVHDGYFSDFNRNWAVTQAKTDAQEAHAQLIAATAAGFATARAGNTAADVNQAMQQVLSDRSDGSSSGRLGHGLGMSLTEWPSLIPTDHTMLEPGMILTLEPVVATEQGIMVHEENIVVTTAEPYYISPPAKPELPVI